MAATKPRSSSARRAGGSASKRAGGSAAKRAGKTAARATKAPGESPGKKAAGAVKHPVKSVARAAFLKALKTIGRKATEMAGDGVRSATDRAAAASKGALENTRLPVQASIDVAVPLLVAWEEWMSFDTFTEGVHRVEDVERDGDELVGTIAGPRGAEWRAEVVDEREQEAFAWRSVEGSDCAGLVTFHRLSERLTRIELDLDVVPTKPAETLTLSLHLADRRVQTDLRRFKAQVEFINPDVYESDLRRNGHAPDSQNDE